MLKHTLIVLMLLAQASLYAQYRITGTVMDKNSSAPIQGVSIKFSKDQVGAVTDEKGRFAIISQDGGQATLLISHIGYHAVDTTIALPPRQSLSIAMAPKANTIEEVQVSTGYQTLPRERLTGSFEVVSNELFNRQISQDVISRLDGLVPGTLFDKRAGNNMAFSIRGLSTISPTIAQPLIIVDDFPYEGDILNINPNDVESITFLKDAAAASIWGARAGNGVVVITTKKGMLNKPFAIAASANVSIQDRPDLYYLPQMAPADFIDIERFLFDQGAFDNDLGNTVTWPVITPAVEIMERQRQGLITGGQAESMLAELRTRDIRRDLMEYIYQRPVAQQYALNMNGGSDRLSYLISGGLDKSIAQQVGDGYQRITLRTQSTFKPVKNLEIQAGMVYANSLRENNGLGDLRTGTSGTIYPYARLMDDDGRPAIIEQYYRLGFVDTVGQGKLLDWHYRPLAEIDLADHTIRVSDVLMNLSAKYQIIPSLNAEVRYQYQHQQTVDRNYRSEETFYTRNQINRFTQISGDDAYHPFPLGGILQLTEGNRRSHNVRGQLNFSKDWANSHRLIALMGAEVRQAENLSYASTSYGYDDELMLAQPIDLVSRYPIYGGMGFDSPLGQAPTFSGLMNRFVSVFANASYTLKSNHVFTGSARRDASNLFGVATNDKWKPLWSAGYKWKLSDAPFYGWQWLPELSMRATYGHSGNVNNTIAAVTTIDYRGLSPLGRNQYAFIVNPPNADLRWENVATTNLGLDFGLQGNGITGSIEYFSKYATDLISQVPADLTTGFDNLTRNAAEIKTTGWDISLSSRNMQGAFGWNSDFFLSLNRTDIKKYLVERSRASTYVGNGASLLPIEGYDAYNVVSYRWGGLDPENGNPRAYVNGELSSDYAHIINNATMGDLVFHGSAMPRAFGSLRNTWTYRGLVLSANITYRTGYYFRRPTVDYVSLLNNGVVAHADYYLRWQQPGDEVNTSVPSMIYPTDSRRDQIYRDSEATVEKGDHIRLQDINLSYRVDKASFRALPAHSATVTLYARNLPILWRAGESATDPDFRRMPEPFSVSIGFNLNF
ncbi:SusC/RagA family TonB-linked outer membrane protein [Parapedobacter tibetensis]|uniref:SusC/RagA family TonB-linked outer membrane protein n=1 Tax=Parapedobacter tibetensis TaxID=2972951 RepID=UPI00214D4553|nr:SusC/RagA family TonB-linked outer membrane protein [Parapedobacter tibetensis]